jgi:serine/threonine-protein kinase RsbT
MATILKADTLPIRSSTDVVSIRQATRARAAEIRLGIVDQTKLITAASELARNALEYGKGGEALFEVINDGARQGLRIHFRDQGPGIEDLALALTDHYSTGGGLGLGLSGAKRLVDEFEIDSKPGEGTRVTITKWN